MRKKKNTKKSLADYYTQKYTKSLTAAKATDTNENNIDAFDLKMGNYTLKMHILKNPWLKKGRPASEAIKWLFRTVFKDPQKYRHNKMLLNQGNLYAFEYKNPKYKGTSQLPWFDKFPLVLALGPVSTKEGIRNIGFNIHLLPIKIRVIVLTLVFDFYKKLYRYQLFHNQENKPVNIKYQYIVAKLAKYGVKFAIRMYIPSRMNQIVKFPYKEWNKAVFIPSRGYSDIRAAQLEKEWKKHVKAEGFNTNPNLNWKTVYK